MRKIYVVLKLPSQENPQRTKKKSFKKIKYRTYFFPKLAKNVILNHFWFNEESFFGLVFRTFLINLKKEFFIEPSEMV